MASYKVLSNNFTIAPQGDVVDDKALESVNIEALLAGGHLAPVGKKADDPEGKDK